MIHRGGSLRLRIRLRVPTDVEGRLARGRDGNRAMCFLIVAPLASFGAAFFVKRVSK